MTEIWKDVVGYEGRYQVSNLGRIKRITRITKWISINGKEAYRLDKEKIFSLEVGKTGYPIIRLHKNGHKRRVTVHRLVAQAFIPNPQNKPCINHKDGNRTNNNINNLEWCTYSENNLHEWRCLKKKAYNALKVKRIDTGQIFDTLTEAAKSIGASKTNLSGALKRNGTCGGIKWEIVIQTI